MHKVVSLCAPLSGLLQEQLRPNEGLANSRGQALQASKFESAPWHRLQERLQKSPASMKSAKHLSKSRCSSQPYFPGGGWSLHRSAHSESAGAGSAAHEQRDLLTYSDNSLELEDKFCHPRVRGAIPLLNGAQHASPCLYISPGTAEAARSEARMLPSAAAHLCGWGGACRQQKQAPPQQLQHPRHACAVAAQSAPLPGHRGAGEPWGHARLRAGQCRR